LFAGHGAACLCMTAGSGGASNRLSIAGLTVAKQHSGKYFNYL